MQQIWTGLLVLALMAAGGAAKAQRLSWAPVGTKWVYGYDEWEPENGPANPEYSAYGVLEVKSAANINGQEYRRCWLEICGTCDVREDYEAVLMYADSATLYRVSWPDEIVQARDCNAVDTLRAFQPLFHHCPRDSSPVVLSANSIDSLCYRAYNVRDTTIGPYTLCVHDVRPAQQSACALPEITPCPRRDWPIRSTWPHHFTHLNQKSRSIEGIGLLDAVLPFYAIKRVAAELGRTHRANLRCFFHPDMGWVNFETGELNSNGCFRYRGTGSRTSKVSRQIRYAYETSTQLLRVLEPGLQGAECKLYDAWGREVLARQLSDGTLATGQLPLGVYVAVLKDPDATYYSLRFINF